MSYDISLVDPVTKEVLVLEAPHHVRGGTYAIGGENRAHLNITYNYGGHYQRAFGNAYTKLTDYERMFGHGDTGVRSIYGLTGAQSLPILRKAASLLGDDVDPNYWTATEGNAKRALLQLITLAEMRPDGVWQGD